MEFVQILKSDPSSKRFARKIGAKIRKSDMHDISYIELELKHKFCDMSKQNLKMLREYYIIRKYKTEATYSDKIIQLELTIVAIMLSIVQILPNNEIKDNPICVILIKIAFCIVVFLLIVLLAIFIVEHCGTEKERVFYDTALNLINDIEVEEKGKPEDEI